MTSKEKNAEYSRRWRKRNPEKYRDAVHKWRTKNPEKVRAMEARRVSYHREYMREWKKRHYDFAKGKDAQLRIKFGITYADYQEMVRAQDGGCAICGEECPSGRQLAVDHDHATGRVRGLLCGPCNSGLGHFRDRVALLRAAADYLEKLS